MTQIAADFTAPKSKSPAPVTKVFSLDGGLTREGLTVLREAKDISFHRNRLPSGEIEERITVWGTGDHRYAAAANFTRFIDESGYWSRGAVEQAFSSHSIYECHLRSIISLLRMGDKLSLEWKPGALTNQYMQGAKADHTFAPYSDGKTLWSEGEWSGLHGDSLSLIIDRPATTSRKAEKLTFLVDVGITPDNSARMIRKVADR